MAGRGVDAQRVDQACAQGRHGARDEEPGDVVARYGDEATGDDGCYYDADDEGQVADAALGRADAGYDLEIDG